MKPTSTLGAHLRRSARRAAAMLLLGVCWSCAHTSIRQVGDCDRVPAEQRIACAACTLKNEAKGWIGDYEYRPDNDPDARCVRVN
ncbi:MAG TPA: hypothetical protein VEQ15_05805 [Myxococcales bacterium]|jgi:hypothetical protein|nr:hypothetical protein [Myxococcales bacterium]